MTIPSSGTETYRTPGAGGGNVVPWGTTAGWKRALVMARGRQPAEVTIKA